MLPGSAMSQPPPTAHAAARAKVSARAPRNTTAAPETMPCSLPAAISDPEKVMAPMRMSSPPVMEVRTGTWVARAKSLTASSAAAPPPTALNRLTSCGMAVIATVRAV